MRIHEELTRTSIKAGWLYSGGARPLVGLATGSSLSTGSDY